MLELRITYYDENEINEFKDTLEKSFDIISTSKAYDNRNSKEKRVYIKLEGRKDK